MGKKGNPICITILITTIFAFLTTFLLPVVCFTDQKYTEVIGGLANYNINKSAELWLYKGMLALACLFAGFFAWKITKKNEKSEIHKEDNKQAIDIWNKIGNPDKSLIIGGLLVSMNLLIYLFAHTYSIKLIMMSITYFYIMLTRKDNLRAYMMCYIGIYYSITGLYNLYVTLFQWTNVKLWPNGSFLQIEIQIITILCFFILMVVNENLKCEGALRHIFHLSRFLIVLNFCIYFRSSYEYGNEIIHLPYAFGYYVVILCIMLLLWWNECKDKTVYIIQKCRGKNGEKIIKEDTQGDDHQFVPSFSMVATILMMNSFIVPAQIVPTDLWHHGEQITGWHQIFDMEQRLYVDFCPSSGCYSIPLGFVLKYICGDTASGYASAYSLLSLLICMVVAFLMYRLVGGQIAFAVVLFSAMPIYNRGYCILPMLLILAMPRLIERKSDWLKVWIFGSLIAGLYYPIYGVALAIGTMPFAVVQLFDYMKSLKGNIRKFDVSSLKNSYEILSWILVVGICIAAVPLLIHMAQYVLVQANQSFYTDSIPLITGTQPPDLFFVWLSKGVRYAFYLFMRIYIPMLSVSLSMTLIVIGVTKKSREKFLHSNLFMALSAAVLIQIIGYSFTLLRADFNALISRTYMTILPTTIFMFCIIYKYGKLFFHKNVINISLLILFLYFSVGIVAIAGEVNFPNTENGTPVGGFVDDSVRMMSRYHVNEIGFSQVDDNGQNLLLHAGNGFYLRSYIKNSMKQKEFIVQHGLENEKIVDLDRFMYYVMDAKACLTDSTHTMAGNKAQEMCIQSYIKDLPLFFDDRYITGTKIESFLLEHHYKVLDNGILISEKTVNDYGLQEYVADEWTPDITSDIVDFGLKANAWGKSINSLVYNSELSVCEDDVSPKYLYLKLDTSQNQKKDNHYQTWNLDEQLYHYFTNNRNRSRYEVEVQIKNRYQEGEKDICTFIANVGNGELVFPLSGIDVKSANLFLDIYLRDETGKKWPCSYEEIRWY